jgi:hypothetical protein
MLAFLLDEKTQQHVIDIFNFLTERLGIIGLRKLLAVIFTDNGVKFNTLGNWGVIHTEKSGLKFITVIQIVLGKRRD